MFSIVVVIVPIDPGPTVPKLHVEARGVAAMTAPCACIASEMTCGVSSAASVVTVNVSANNDASFGSATSAGIAFGETVKTRPLPVESGAGNEAPVTA